MKYLLLILLTLYTNSGEARERSSRMVKIPTKYFDNQGMMGNMYAPGKLDFGDSLQRNFSVDCLRYFLKDPEFVMILVNIPLYESPDKKHFYRRHNDRSKWYGKDDFRTSRDQTTPLAIALGLYGYENRLKGFMKHNRFFATNTIQNWVTKEKDSYPLTKWERIKFYFGWKPKDENGNNINVYAKKMPDILLFERHGQYARGLGASAWNPKVILGDLHTLLGSIVRRFNDDKDVLNHCLSLMYAGTKSKSILWPLLKLANDKEDLKAKLRRYFNGPDPVELGELYGLALDEVLK